jgi:hypothetical protein
MPALAGLGPALTGRVFGGGCCCAWSQAVGGRGPAVVLGGGCWARASS